MPFLSPYFFTDLMAMHYGIAVFVKDLLEGSIIMLLTFWNRFNVCDAAVRTGGTLAFGREQMCFCSQKHTIQSGSEPYHCVTLERLLMQCSLCTSSTHEQTHFTNEADWLPFTLGKYRENGRIFKKQPRVAIMVQSICI